MKSCSASERSSESASDIGTLIQIGGINLAKKEGDFRLMSANLRERIFRRVEISSLSMSVVQWITLVGTASILGVSAYHLYLAQIKEDRSEVKLLHQDNWDQGAFVGGSSGRWNGSSHLKLVNTGEKGVFVADVDREIVEFRKNGESVESEDVELSGPFTDRINVGDEIEPEKTQRFRDRVNLEGDDEYLLDHDTAVIRHIIVVEDNKGSYTVSEGTELGLQGPSHVREEFGLE